MHTLYIGTYTQSLPYVDGKGEGIYSLEMDPQSGALSAPRLAAPTTNPSFLALDGRRGRLFAVNELERWHNYPGGAVSAFILQPGGALKRVNQRLSGGAAPCYLSLAPAGEAVLVANYVTGTVARLSISHAGALRLPAPVFGHAGTGPRADRQEAPHAHSIAPDPSGRWALAADLGADKLYIYRLSPSRMEPYGAVQLQPGAGPRHFAFSADGRRLYLANELDSTVSYLTFDPASAHIEQVQTLSALPASGASPVSRSQTEPPPNLPHFGFAQMGEAGGGLENTLADLHLHPNGRFLYASNRGHDSLAVFAIAPDGALSALGHVPSGGRTPRNFALTPDGRFLIAANQDSNNLVVFAVDAESGALTSTGIEARVPTPVCVVA